MDYKKIENEFSVKLYPNERESQIAAMRLSVCFLCAYKTTDSNSKMCSKCNCYLDSKVFNQTSKCPINKWLI
jgi:hypothetical protein